MNDVRIKKNKAGIKTLKYCHTKERIKRKTRKWKIERKEKDKTGQDTEYEQQPVKKNNGRNKKKTENGKK